MCGRRQLNLEAEAEAGVLFNPFLCLWALPGNRCTRVGAQLHSRGVWFEKQPTHSAFGRHPFVSPHFYQMCDYSQPLTMLPSEKFEKKNNQI